MYCEPSLSRKHSLQSCAIVLRAGSLVQGCLVAKREGFDVWSEGKAKIRGSRPFWRVFPQDFWPAEVVRADEFIILAKHSRTSRGMLQFLTTIPRLRSRLLPAELWRCVLGNSAGQFNRTFSVFGDLNVAPRTCALVA